MNEENNEVFPSLIEEETQEAYENGFEHGFYYALQSMLDDDANHPAVLQAREWYEKKARNANS